MPYALRFDGVNDVVSIPSGMTGNVGTSTYSFRIKSGPAGITLPASGLAGIIGTTQATTSNGLIVNSTGQIRVYSAGTNRYGSTAQLIFSGVPFDYTLTHVSAAGAWDIYNNLTASPTGESGNFTTSATWTAGSNALNQFGRSSSNNAVYLQGDIASIEVTGLANAQDWEADLSGGAGSTLPTVSGTNQGTLVNFTVPDCWIFYSSGAYDITAQGGAYSYSGASASVSINRQVDATGAAYIYSGASADVAYNRFIEALGGTFSYSGASASLTYETATAFNLNALGGNFAYSGANAELTYVQLNSYLLTALGATYSYQGAQASLTATGVIPQANPSAFVVSAYIGSIETVKASVGGVTRINAIIDSRLTINARLSQ